MGTHIFIKDISIVLHVIGEHIGGCAHHQRVAVPSLSQYTSSDGRHSLVDVEERDISNALAEGHPAPGGPQALMWVVDEHLQV